MITNNGSYGKGEHDAFLKSLQSRSITPLDDQVVTTDQKELHRAAHVDPQQESAGHLPRRGRVESGLIVKQARSLGITAPFAGGARPGHPVYLSTAGCRPRSEGTFVSSPYLSNDINDASRKFSAAYKAAYNEDAELPRRQGVRRNPDPADRVEGEQRSRPARPSQTLSARPSTRGCWGSFAYDDTGVGIFATAIGTITNGSWSRPADHGRRGRSPEAGPAYTDRPSRRTGEQCRSRSRRSSGGSASVPSTRWWRWGSRSCTAPWAW
jgi:branched-chain amino acid transport system substrate-binding protein